ncbi:MAG: ROK family protein [Bacteroidota bacterium]
MDLILGIDIGGTNIKMGLVHPEGQILRQLSLSTSSLSSLPVFLDHIHKSIQSLLSQHRISSSDLMGIGVGAPGHSSNDGTILEAVNLPFKEKIPIGHYLRAQLNLPVILRKDAKAAAMGEKYWGAGKATNHFTLLMLGTGLGYATYADGKILDGFQGLAGEYGHMILKVNGRKCNCGKSGCLETYLSATGLKRTAVELLAIDNRSSALRDYTYNQINTKLIAALAQEGDVLSKEAFRITGEYLGWQMANLCEQLTPELFILAGGLVQAGDLLIEPAKAFLNKNVQPFYKDRIQIQTSSLGPSEVGILGAAALILDQQHYYNQKTLT